MAIQDRIDAQVAAGKLRIVARGESGDAVLPDVTSADFYDCIIGQLTAGRGCSVVIEGGSAASVTLSAGAAGIARKAELTDVTLESGRFEVSEGEVKSILASGASTIRSSNVEFSGSGYAAALSGASVWRSFSDSFRGQSVADVGVGCRAALAEADVDVSGDLCLAKGEVLFDGGTVKCQVGGRATGISASLEIRGCRSFRASLLPSAADGAKVSCVSMPEMDGSVGGFVGDGASSISVIAVEAVSAGDGVLVRLADKSRIEIARFDTVKAGTLLAVEDGCAIRIGHGRDVTVERMGDAGALSRLVVDDVERLACGTGLGQTGASCELIDIGELVPGALGFNLEDNSALRLTRIGKVDFPGWLAAMDLSVLAIADCPEITGSGSDALIAGTSQGSVVMTGCPSVNLAGPLLRLDGIWTATFQNCGGLVTSGQDELIVVTSTGGAVVSIASTQRLATRGAVCIRLEATDMFATACTVQNNGQRGAVTGTPEGGVGQQQLQASKCDLGSLDLEGYSCEMFAVTFRKFLFTDCDLATRRCIQKGSWSGDDAAFTGSVLLDRRSEWESKVHAGPGSVLEHWRPLPHKGWSADGGVVHVWAADKRGTSGLEGGDAGSSFATAGWQVDSVIAGASKADAFDLRVFGSPSYSGKGSMVALSGTPPEPGSLDYFWANWDNLRILDSRECYMDVTDRHMRKSPTFGQDKMDAEYYLDCQKAVEKATTTFQVQGISQVEITSDVEIVEQAPVVKEQQA